LEDGSGEAGGFGLVEKAELGVSYLQHSVQVRGVLRSYGVFLGKEVEVRFRDLGGFEGHVLRDEIFCGFYLLINFDSIHIHIWIHLPCHKTKLLRKYQTDPLVKLLPVLRYLPYPLLIYLLCLQTGRITLGREEGRWLRQTFHVDFPLYLHLLSLFLLLLKV